MLVMGFCMVLVRKPGSDGISTPSCQPAGGLMSKLDAVTCAVIGGTSLSCVVMDIKTKSAKGSK
ncbi:MAG: hypothetical protein JXA95_11205 [Spirochaetales bacterium]|nr:hypothetical protein [Spirochaetales bacterium]